MTIAEMHRTIRADPTSDLNLALRDTNNIACTVRGLCRRQHVLGADYAAGLTFSLNRVAAFCHQHAAALKRAADPETGGGRLHDAELLAAITAQIIATTDAGYCTAAQTELACSSRAAKQLRRWLADAQRQPRQGPKLEFEFGEIHLAPYEAGQKNEPTPDSSPEPILVPQQPSRPQVEPSVSAGRLVAAATRLLPAADQERYAREFESELWELAARGASPAEQVRYSLRQALHVAELRNAALGPRSQSASP